MVQLSDFQNYNTDNMVFSKPEVGNIPGQKINFKRVRIATKYTDGSVGDLIFSTPEKLHSFGLQESRDLATNKLNGYVLPLCLWNRNGPTENEKSFTELFNVLSEHCKKYLLEHKEEIEKYDLDMSDLKKFNPLFWKMDKGKPVEGRGPMLYVKVLLNKKNNKINTIFVDEETNKEIDPFTILNKPCNVTAAIKFESIFVGNKISLQVKLYEVVVKKIETGIRGLLRPNATKIELTDDEVQQAGVGKPMEVNTYSVLSYDDDDDEDDEEEEEINESENGSIVEEEPVKQEVIPPIQSQQEVVEEVVSKKKPPAKPRGKKATV
jgi:hypothetical protein